MCTFPCLAHAYMVAAEVAGMVKNKILFALVFELADGTRSCLHLIDDILHCGFTARLGIL